MPSYNATELPPGPDRLPLLMATVLKKRIRLQGFIIAQDYGHRIHEFQKEMGQWVKEDKICSTLFAGKGADCG